MKNIYADQYSFENFKTMISEAREKFRKLNSELPNNDKETITEPVKDETNYEPLTKKKKPNIPFYHNRRRF